MVSVFISFADSDAAVAGRLAADLRLAAVEVWMAPGSIRPGEPFAAAIDRGLENSEYVAILLSPTAMASAWVQSEVYAALDRAHQRLTTILPLLLRPVAVPPLLSGFQQIDFADYERGLTAVGAALGISVDATATAPTIRKREARAAQRPPDAFTAQVLTALESGSQRSGYAVARTAPEQEVFLDAIVEIALLRIGVLTQRDKKPIGQLLGAIERELRENRQRVVGVLAVVPGDEPVLQDYQLLGAATPNVVILTWSPRFGVDAVTTAVPVVVDLLTGRG
jgi:hypothetical protein